MKCSEYQIPEFTNDCDSLKHRGLPIRVFYNPKTKEVFDENKIYMGKGELREDGEFFSLNVEIDYHERNL